ncbi:tetratricopeptide repeat protein [Flavobacterium sp. CYK-55]|uniref:tetratricopeptide repeat protein n=1 Tax=Flavobacterium sp. CYK-55 TaxID=2835529 RepID=UPI001BCAD9F0|nr:tetratricopeptide repeat protein [Flavobacterium sp. CYK-55]MBS7787250.1 tetratricopeptide repeat protein [Flavobacterium sp. CYK-55]
MNTLKIFSLLLLGTATISQAQDIEQAKKAMDAEQYEKAKSMLKSIIQAKPANGKAAFFLGNVYLKQNIEDSAKIYFQKGLTATDGGRLNYIGLGQIDLDNNNPAAAKTNFDSATKDMKKKDIEEYIYVAKAYMNSDKHDYKTALEYLNKAKAINPSDALTQMALGDAYYGEKNQNEAYAAYRNAFQTDPTLIRAKMQLGVLLKGAKSYTEAVRAFDNVIAADANYGPVYRELAETYYYWGNNEPKKYNEYIQKALSYYEKYMSMTDYSLTSRMRHADFLILAKDYKALEVEANKMKELDKVNPRILRYLGYSAYENGNVDVAIKSLQDFIGNPSNKIIARDHLYLGLAKLRKANNLETKTLDQNMFNAGVADIKKSVEMEINMTNDLSEVGKKFYEQKLFKEASVIYEIATSNINSKNYLLDNFYLGNSLYYNNTRKDVVKPDPIELQKADAAFGRVIEASPTTQDAYIFRARANRLLENEEMIIKYYEDYLRVVTEKGPDEVTKNKAKFIESYNNIAASYANTDVAKAKEYFNKTLALDPANTYATESLKSLGSGKK